LRTLNSLFVAQLRERTVDVDGHFFYLDPHDSLGLSVMGSFEPAETELMRQRVRPGATVLDIGANIGYFTLLMARCVGPSGHVYAFEPEPKNFELLQHNVRRNNYANVTCGQAAKAISVESGKFLILYATRAPRERESKRT
jgi:tRNA G37 N-methylase Trm5